MARLKIVRRAAVAAALLTVLCAAPAAAELEPEHAVGRAALLIERINFTVPYTGLAVTDPDATAEALAAPLLALDDGLGFVDPPGRDTSIELSRVGARERPWFGLADAGCALPEGPPPERQPDLFRMAEPAWTDRDGWTTCVLWSHDPITGWTRPGREAVEITVASLWRGAPARSDDAAPILIVTRSTLAKEATAVTGRLGELMLLMQDAVRPTRPTPGLPYPRGLTPPPPPGWRPY